MTDLEGAAKPPPTKYSVFSNRCDRFVGTFQGLFNILIATSLCNIGLTNVCVNGATFRFDGLFFGENAFVCEVSKRVTYQYTV